MASKRNQYKASRAKTEREIMLREHEKQVSRLKRWCEKHDVPLKTFDEADAEDICVYSKSDYELEDERHMIFEDNDSYFLTPKDYEMYRSYC